ncbi:MAG: hypothetical protein ACO3B3_02350 [Cyanobium sp.]
MTSPAMAVTDYDKVTLTYQWLVGEPGLVPLPYVTEPNGIGDLQDVMSAYLENIDGDNGVSVTLTPLWPGPSDQNVTQVAFQLYEYDDNEVLQKFVAGDVSYSSTEGEGCLPSPDGAVQCSLTSIAFDKKINGAGTNDVNNLNFLIDLPPGPGGDSGGGIAPRLSTGESLTLLFYGAQGKNLRVNNFMTPAITNPSEPPPYYSCAHIQSISTGGGGQEGSRTVCATEFEEAETPREDVPSPLGVLGVAAALRSSRQLRKRLGNRMLEGRHSLHG